MKDSILFYCFKTIEYSFYALFFLVPLVLSNDTSELFELNKMWLTWGVTLIVAAAWIVKMILHGQVKIVRTPLDIPILLFLLSQFFSTIFSQDIQVSLWGYYSRFNGGFYSLLSYIFLYYAFVSNYHEIAALQRKKSVPFLTKLGILTGGGVLLLLSLPLAKPADATSTGHPMVFYITLLVMLGMAIYALRSSFFNRLLLITLYSALIVTLWGIPSHYSSDPTCYLFRGSLNIDCWTESFAPNVRIFSTLGQPAWLAAYLAFLLPVSVAYALNRVSLLKATFLNIWNKRFFIFYLLSLLFYIALIFANTRGGYLAFLLGNGVFWLSLLFLTSQYWKSIMRAAVVVNVSFLLVTFLFGIPINQLQQFTLPIMLKTHEAKVETPVIEPSREQIAETPQQQQTTQDPVITESGNIRLNVWQGAINAWKANPIFGTGVETFAFAYYAHKPAAQNLTSEWDFLYNKAHNEYLNYLATTGLVGLATHLLLIVWFLFHFCKWTITGKWFWFTNPKKEEYEEDNPLLRRRILILAFVAGYITILVSNFFGFSVVIMNLFLFLTPAFVFVLNGTLRQSRVFALPAKTNESTASHLTGMQWTGIVFVLLVTFYLNMVLLRYWSADKAYALGSNLDRIGEYGQALPHLENAVKLRSGEPTFKDELAFNYGAIGSSFILQQDQVQGTQYISKATQLSSEVIQAHPNNVVFWKNRVRLYYLLSQVDPNFLPVALESIQKANALAPNDAKILYNYGVILGQMGRIDEGIAKLEETLTLKPDFRDVYFALALFYREKATEGGETVRNPEHQKKAEDTLNFILTNISATDKQVIETLDSWK